MLVIRYLVSVHKEKQVSSGNSRQWIKTTLDIGWLRILILWSGLKMPHSDQGVLVKSSSFRKLLGEYREKGQLWHLLQETLVIARKVAPRFSSPQRPYSLPSAMGAVSSFPPPCTAPPNLILPHIPKCGATDWHTHCHWVMGPSDSSTKLNFQWTGALSTALEDKN